MESKRLKRVGSLLREEMSKVLQELKLSSGEPNVLLTATDVKVSPDLSTTTFYISIFNSSLDNDWLGYLKQNNALIRGMLGKQVKSVIRVVPEVEFYLDKTAAHAQRIDELLKLAKEQDEKLKGE